MRITANQPLLYWYVTIDNELSYIISKNIWYRLTIPRVRYYHGPQPTVEEAKMMIR